jgi:hypothetical protein
MACNCDMRSNLQSARRSLELSSWLAHTLVGLACSDDTATVVGAEGAAPDGPAYVVSTMVSSDDGTTGYVSVLDSLEPQTIDNENAREFAGAADIWVHEGAVFVSNDEAFTISKFVVEDGALVEQGVLSFAAYGLGSFGFWLNRFVAADKAYFLNDTAEYIVWDPASMEITGTLPLPAPAAREGFRAFTAYSDRASILKDGLLYQPFYYTDDSYFLFAPDTRILVIDVASDLVLDAIDAPCPGLDYATVDGDGNLYFSSWVYAAGGAAVLDQPDTCVFEIPARGAPRVAFRVADVSDGRQGGVMRYVANGRAMISVLHDERFPPSDAPSASELTFANNWRFWSYDLASGGAAPLESIDWNGGAQYSFDIDQRTYMLVAASDYSTTRVYDLGDGLSLTPVFDTEGWATRLFKVR